MADSKQINIQSIKDVQHVTFNESRILDESSIKAIYDEITDIVEKTPKTKLILDFDQVDYLSSAVLGKMVALNKEIKKAELEIKDLMDKCLIPYNENELIKILTK